MHVEHAWLIFAIYMLLLLLFLVMSHCINIERLFCILSRSNRVEGESVEETFPDEYSIQFPSVNFASTVINSLPMSQFKKGERKEEKEMPVNDECAICLGEFEEGEWLNILPSCTHGFHVSCIDTWFRSHSNCPLCRSCVSHNLVVDAECSVSLYTLIQVETLSREEFSTEPVAHLQSIPSEFPQNLEIGHQFCPD